MTAAHLALSPLFANKSQELDECGRTRSFVTKRPKTTRTVLSGYSAIETPIPHFPNSRHALPEATVYCDCPGRGATATPTWNASVRRRLYFTSPSHAQVRTSTDRRRDSQIPPAEGGHSQDVAAFERACAVSGHSQDAQDRSQECGESVWNVDW